MAHMEGSFLFSFGFTGSDKAVALVAETEAVLGPRSKDASHQFLIDNAPMALKELIVSDFGFELGVTKFVFVLLHLSMMICASFAYGFTVTWQDDFSSWLVGLF